MQSYFHKLAAIMVIILPTLMIGCISRASQKEIHNLSGDGDTLVNVAAQLVTKYPAGQVSLCIHEQDSFYYGQRNAPDGGGELYDLKGTQIGACHFNTSQIHPFCRFEWECKTIYRSVPNIWGLPEVKFTLED